MRRYLCNRLGNKPNFGIVTIAASLGGVEALIGVLSALPSDFPVPIVIAQHLYPHAPTNLPVILAYETCLQSKLAEEGDVLQPATIYIAPPNHHLIVQPKGILSLTSGLKVSFARPSADVLFNSVASIYRERAIGVILTGKLFDGAAGVKQIKAMGGRVISQDYASSAAFDMPRAAIETGAVDFVLPLKKIAPALISMVMIEGIEQLLGGSMPLGYSIS